MKLLAVLLLSFWLSPSAGFAAPHKVASVGQSKHATISTAPAFRNAVGQGSQAKVKDLPRHTVSARIKDVQGKRSLRHLRRLPSQAPLLKGQVDKPLVSEQRKKPLAKEMEKSSSPFGDKQREGEHPISTEPSFTWRNRSKVGEDCEPGGPALQCGHGLVCRRGFCRHCMTDSECPSLHHCFKVASGENVCNQDAQLAWEKVASDPSHALCSLIIFLSAVLAAAAGTGGGGMFVPLLVLFAVLKAESAVPLSQCMIFCGSSLQLFWFIAQRHSNYPEQPKIDYDCIYLFQPMLSLGVTFGVLLHRMSPQWFLLLLLCLTLGLALWRTSNKGIKQMEEEKRLLASGSTEPATSTYNLCAYASEVVEVASKKSTQVVGVAFVWLLMFVASFHGLSPCTRHFGIFMGALAGLLILFTYLTTQYIFDGSQRGASAVDWVSNKVSSSSLGIATFPLVAFGGGLLGGLLGIGGGMIMSPLLLEMGMHTESVQATTAVIVFLSSSLATIQFALLKQIVWHYALWYGGITVIATILGQRLCEVYVRRTGRYSLVTLSIAGVLVFSLFALVFVGTEQVNKDVENGQQMWWSTARLCDSGRVPMYDVDHLFWHSKRLFDSGNQ